LGYGALLLISTTQIELLKSPTMVNNDTLKSNKEEGIRQYYTQKIDEAETQIRERSQNLKRLEAQRNELNSRGKKNERKKRGESN
jgi:hypothetical protein